MTEQAAMEEKPIVLWNDTKLLFGALSVLLSIVFGFFGKGLLIVKFYEPIYLYTGLSIWAFSWLLLFFGIFLVGWETVKMIQYKIHHHVKRTVKGTYEYTKTLPKKGVNYTKELHRNGLGKITKTSKIIVEKLRW